MRWDPWLLCVDCSVPGYRCIQVFIPVYSGYTCIWWVYLYIVGIPVYSGYTCIWWVYLYIVGIPVYSGYTCI